MASRKDQKDALREQRAERQRQAESSAARKRIIGIVVAVILVAGIVAAIVLAVASSGGGGGAKGGGGGETVSYPDGGEIPEQKQTDLKKAVAASGCKLEQHPASTARVHKEGSLKYSTNPPHSGEHNPTWAEDDIYSEAPQLEKLVHALEHGRILVWIRPNASEQLLGQLKALYDEDPYHVILTPKDDLKEQLAVSVWTEKTGYILRCPNPSDATWDAIRALKDEHRDKGPEFVP